MLFLPEYAALILAVVDLVDQFLMLWAAELVVLLRLHSVAEVAQFAPLDSTFQKQKIQNEIFISQYEWK